VLSGAVLTAYVGITGLIRRMAKVRRLVRLCVLQHQLVLQHTFELNSAVAAERHHCTTAALLTAAA
jgi:hypothetical protein